MDYKAAAELLRGKNNYLILTHKNPDGDTVGSAAALCSALRRLGKTAYLYKNKQIGEKLSFYVSSFFAPEDYRGEFIIAVDTASESQFPEGFEGRVDLCVDHHPSNTHYAEKLLLKGERASCGEIVFKLIKAMGAGVSNEEADLLYIALSTDTGCFLYGSTDSAAFQTAAELVELGAQNAALNLKFFRRVSRARLRLEGLIYGSMAFYRNGSICVATITREMLEISGATEDDLDDIASLAGRAEGNVVSITIREHDDTSCKISVRTSGDVNSSDICAVFGGGGHTMAAGCMIKESPDKAREMLLAVINEVWK